MDSARNNTTFFYSTNNTNFRLQDHWNFLASFTCFIIIAGTIANIGVLFLFYKRPTQRTPFSVYLIKLLIFDTIIATVLEPFNFVKNYYSSFTLDIHTCIFRQYLGFTVIGGVLASHLLIALNRLWAVVFPISYRNHHSMKVAIVICFGTCLFLHACFVPTVYVASFVTRPDKSDGTVQCSINTTLLGAWSPIIQIGFYDLPILLIVFIYPVICYKSFVKLRKHRIGQQITESQRRGAATKIRQQKVTADGPFIETAFTTVSADATGRAVQAKQKKRISYGSKNGFMTLTLMTLSVVLCMGPVEVYFTYLLAANRDLTRMYPVVKALQTLMTLSDPLLIVLANKDLRKVVKDWVTGCSF